MGLDGIKRALANLMKIGHVSDVNEGLMQTLRVDVNAIDASDDVQRWQQLGFASKPVDGDAALVVSVAGHRFVVAVDDLASRPKDLSAGEVALWHRDGHEVRLKNGQVINAQCKRMVINAEDEFVVNTKKAVTNASTRAVVNSPLTRVSAMLNVGGITTLGATVNVTGAATFAGVLNTAGAMSTPAISVSGKDYAGHTHIDAEGRETSGVNP